LNKNVNSPVEYQGFEEFKNIIELSYLFSGLRLTMTTKGDAPLTISEEESMRVAERILSEVPLIGR
jgi:hypothetical protein